MKEIFSVLNSCLFNGFVIYIYQIFSGLFSLTVVGFQFALFIEVASTKMADLPINLSVLYEG